jgi:site-specific recombinase XerD
MSTRPSIATLIQAFFLDVLVARRGLRPNTLTAYRDGIKLLLNFTAEQRHTPVDKLAVEDFDDRIVVDFLDHLQSTRGNATRSRNTRLAPIHGLFRYIAGQVPESMACCQRICAVPLRKAAHQAMEYLDDAEMGTMLGSINRGSRHGPRDHALVLFMYNTGARVQEVVDLKLDDLRLDTPPQARLFGKGGKNRACPLWAETVQALRGYLDCRSPSQEVYRHVFLNANGQPFTRFGIRYLVRRYAAKAAQRCPSLKGKNVGPHTLRHTTAMHLLQSGNDLSVIKDWLGHADINTTHEYAAIDMKMKQRALDSCQAPTVKKGGNGRPRWLKPGILKWLDDLSEGAGIM